MSDIIKDLLTVDECQPLEKEQMEAIKSQFHPSNTANVNIVPYEIYDEDGVEQVVGEVRKTIDGVKKCKPVYEKIITLTSSNFTQEYNEISHGINNIGDLVEIYGTVYRADDNRQPLPKVHPSGSWILGVGDVTPTTFTVVKGGGYTGTYALVRGSVTILYTKTTDTWEEV